MDHNPNIVKIQKARETLARFRAIHGMFSGNLSISKACDDIWGVLFAELMGAYETVYDYLPKLVNKNWQMKADEKYVRYIRFMADETAVRLEHQTKKGDMVFLRLVRGEKTCHWLTRPSPDWINQPRDTRRPIFDAGSALNHLLYILADAKLLMDIAEMGEEAIQTYEGLTAPGNPRGEATINFIQDSWFKL